MNYENMIFNRALINDRINDMLTTNDFSLNTNYLCSLHRRLFKRIVSQNGTLRDYNVSKMEYILDGKSVDYIDYHGIRAALAILFEAEKSIDYSKLNIESKIKYLADFTAELWIIHPFNEGNTRTTALFILKYLRSLGYDVNNSLFLEYSEYFRDSLVLANYYDYDLGIYENRNYLIDFFKKLLIDKDLELKSTDIYHDDKTKKKIKLPN